MLPSTTLESDSDDRHHSYEVRPPEKAEYFPAEVTCWQFGGPIGVSAMMIVFPPLMYYLWACLVFYDGQLVAPKSLAPQDLKTFLFAFSDLAREVS